MPGFFQSMGTDGGFVVPLLPQCGKCSLLNHCNSPQMEVFGKGKKGILICGQSPGKTEDRLGRPFIGKSGHKLTSTLSEFGVDLEEDCWTTNALRCWPHHSDGKNRTPTKKEVNYCRPYLIQAVKELKPRIILLLGQEAIQSLIAWLWRPSVGPVGRWVGWGIPEKSLNCWICPTYHPSFLIRETSVEVAEVIWRKHLKAACQLEDRPWDIEPTKLPQRLMFNTDQAADLIKWIQKEEKPFAWDLETDSLKPENPDCDIICCSIANDTYNLAFPWHGQAVKAMLDLLQSLCPKRGWSNKFEHRWMKRKHGISVRNWQWDGMLTSHILDNRKLITGLEFQAFVRLGQRPWDGAVAEFMTSKGNNSRNRLREVPLADLMKYCLTDSIYEWEISKLQRKELGYDRTGILEQAMASGSEV